MDTLRPRPPRTARHVLERRLALPHPAPRVFTPAGHRWRWCRRCLRDDQLRLGHQRRLSRIRLRLLSRQKRRCLDRPLPHRLRWRGLRLARLDCPHHPGRENDPHLLRHTLTRRHRLQRRRRHLLHRQPRPLERIIFAEMAQARLIPRQSHRQQIPQARKPPRTARTRQRLPRACRALEIPRLHPARCRSATWQGRPVSHRHRPRPQRR